MIIGIPSKLSFQSSNVTDPAMTMEEWLENCQSPVIDYGLEIQGGDWVYEYRGDVDFTPKTWSQTDEDKGVYQLDEIIFKDCKLVKVTGKSGTGITTHRRPLEPEAYSGGWDTSMDPSKWSHRWVRVSTKTNCGWLEKVWNNNDRQYTIIWDNCIDQYCWVMRDLANVCVNAYKTLLRSSKYTSATDVKARIISWGAPYHNKQPTVQMRSMVERAGYFFLRTNINAPLQYETWTTGTAYQYTYMEVITPADIDGFYQRRVINCLNPFDGKGYTRTVFDTSLTNGMATWTFVVESDCSSIAFGRVICNSIDMRITDQDANVIFEINNYEIDNTVDDNHSIEYETTRILYADNVIDPSNPLNEATTIIPAGSVVVVTLHAAIVTLGELLPSANLKSGFTKLSFRNTFKDFSPKEQDQWGNWVYIDGVKVRVHSGTVEYPVVSYDRINRLMMLIGGDRVVIDSSDAIHNELPDGEHVFSATMMIARFTKFDLATSEKNKRLADIALYNFTVEQLV